MANFREMIKSEIRGATITKKELYYSGSIEITKDFLLQSDIVPGEKVQVVNFNNGQRFETYVIEEKDNSGTIALYGPAARLGEIGDALCIISYRLVSDDEVRTVKEKVLLVGKDNKVMK